MSSLQDMMNYATLLLTNQGCCSRNKRIPSAPGGVMMRLSRIVWHVRLYFKVINCDSWWIHWTVIRMSFEFGSPLIANHGLIIIKIRVIDSFFLHNEGHIWTNKDKSTLVCGSSVKCFIMNISFGLLSLLSDSPHCQSSFINLQLCVFFSHTGYSSCLVANVESYVL